jgi:hypothetical protein
MPRHLITGSAALVAALAVPATVSAATPASTGTTTVTVQGPVATALRTRGVRTTAVGPATTTPARRIVLPVDGGRVNAAGTVATVEHEGGLRLRLGSRSVTLASPVVKLGRRSTVRVRLGGATRTVFTLRTSSGALALDGAKGTATTKALDLQLTATGVRLISARLGLRGQRRLPTGRFARVKVDARLGTGSGTGGGTSTGAAPATPAPAGPPAQTSTAVPVVSAAVVWRQRPSWLQYIETGRTAGGEPDPDGGTSALDGATAGPVEQLRSSNGNVVAIPYTYAFPFTSGWYDPTTGRASVSFGGGLRHRYIDHTIDLRVQSPTIELDGASSRLVATVSGQQGAPPEGVRGAYVALDATKAQASRDGNVVTITGIPGAVPTGAGGSVFSGFYPDGDPYGSIDALQLTLGG